MEDNEKINYARKRVEELKGFYSHLFSYILVNIILLLIDVFVSSGPLWFYWVTLFWGIGIMSHAMNVFFLKGLIGKDWEERKMNRIIESMDREKKKRDL